VRDKYFRAAAQDPQQETHPAITLVQVVEKGFGRLLIVLNERGHFGQQLVTVHRKLRGRYRAEATEKAPAHIGD
jgi:hypothetical protein